MCAWWGVPYPGGVGSGLNSSSRTSEFFPGMLFSFPLPYRRYSLDSCLYQMMDMHPPHDDPAGEMRPAPESQRNPGQVIMPMARNNVKISMIVVSVFMPVSMVFGYIQHLTLQYVNIGIHFCWSAALSGVLPGEGQPLVTQAVVSGHLRGQRGKSHACGRILRCRFHTAGIHSPSIRRWPSRASSRSRCPSEIQR